MHCRPGRLLQVGRPERRLLDQRQLRLDRFSAPARTAAANDSHRSGPRRAENAARHSPARPCAAISGNGRDAGDRRQRTRRPPPAEGEPGRVRHPAERGRSARLHRQHRRRASPSTAAWRPTPIHAAVDDPRFPPLRQRGSRRTSEIEISVMTPLRTVADYRAIRLGTRRRRHPRRDRPGGSSCPRWPPRRAGAWTSSWAACASRPGWSATPTAPPSSMRFLVFQAQVFGEKAPREWPSPAAASRKACWSGACPRRRRLFPSSARGRIVETETACARGRPLREAWRRRDRCRLCSHHCRVDDGNAALWRRENRGGSYKTLVYGQPTAVHVDPIEKKPLFHYFPGSQAFSLATAGCNFSCRFCQNWEISQRRPEQVASADLDPPGGHPPGWRAALPHRSPTPITSRRFSSSTCATAPPWAGKQGVPNVMISNGFIEKEPMRELCRVLGAVKIDLKAFSEEVLPGAVRRQAEAGPGHPADRARRKDVARGRDAGHPRA